MQELNSIEIEMANDIFLIMDKYDITEADLLSFMVKRLFSITHPHGDERRKWLKKFSDKGVPMLRDEDMTF